MLLMAVFTYEPEKRDAILKRRAEGLFIPDGATLHGQWSSISGGHVFTLFEVNDPLVGVQCFQGWSNLGKFDVFPVMDTDTLMKAMAAMK